MGDFNDIVSAADKDGAKDKPERNLKGFRNLINGCCFVEIPSKGCHFSWANNRF